MNQNKKWYSLFLVLLISISTVIQPLQAVAAVTAMETMATEAKAINEEIDTTQAEGVVEETKETTEEEIASSSSEVVEESTSSDSIVQETEESKEATVESTTEETEEKPKAKKASESREPIDIRTLLNGKELITGAEIKITHNDKELDYKTESIPSNALVGIKFNYAIPEQLLKDKKLKAGDYYDVPIPSGITINPDTEGSLGQYGTYKVVGKSIRLTFSDAVETLYNIKGSFEYDERLDQNLNPGENEIRVPIDGEDLIVNVNVKPNGGTPISKRSTIGTDKKSIQWAVSINTNLETLNNVKVTDAMPEGLEFKGVKIYEQTINKDGSVGSVSDTPISEDLYTVSGDVITFKDTIKGSYKIVYDTVIKEDKIPENGGNVDFRNHATLEANGESYPAHADATLSFGKLIEKTGPSKDDSFKEQVYSWTVKYNYGNKNLPKNSFILDTLSGDNQQYVTEKQENGQEPVQVWVEGGDWLTRGTDYEVEYIGNNQMKVVFPNGLDKPVKIKYFSKVPFVIDDTNSNIKIQNSVKTDSGAEHGAGGSVTNNGMQKKSNVNYQDRTIDWTVDVNIYQYEMANWELKDTMSEGLTFIENSLKIQEANGPELVLGTDYEFVSKDSNNFHVKFIGPRAVSTNKSYTITYKTGFDYRRNDLLNTATSYWKGTDGKNHTQTAKNKPEIAKNFVNDATKGGSYNAVSKELSWTIKGNYNQEELKNASIVDKIQEGQVYVKDSARVYEASISEKGSIKKGNAVDVPIDFTDNVLTAKLPDGSKKAYILEFKTSLEGLHISKDTYSNTATYTNGKYTKDVTSSVTVPHGGEIVSKTGNQKGKYVNWSVDINRSQSTIHDLVLVDKPSTNQVLDEKSIVIYETTVNESGNLSKSSKALEPGADYTLDLVTDNETGQQELTIKFLKVVKKAYVLEYRSLINTNKKHDNLTNVISYKGDNVETISDSREGSTKVTTSSGSGSGTAAALRVLKLDENNEVPLEGAQFELWATDEYTGDRLQVVRSGETNKYGELKFANLMPAAQYILVETKAPEGYTVSKEGAKGIPIYLDDTGEINLYQTHIVKNDIPRVTFKKVTAKNRDLPGAKFVVKNNAGEYYNGIDNNNKVKWVTDKAKAEELVSGSKGNVEVAGLVPGQYTIEETVAPEGYEKLETTISFEVINENGVIRVKEPIAPIKNKKIPEFVDIEINKIWDDVNNQDGLRKEVSFDLLADKQVIKTITLNEGNKWTEVTNNLPKHRADDEDIEINYEVKEIEIDGYESKAERDFTKPNGDKLGKYTFNVTNTHEVAERNISATKVWNDKDNQDGIRTNDVKVQLYAGEDKDKVKVGDAVTLDESNNWTTTWNKLAVNKSGSEIKYSVEEVAVPEGYTVDITEKESGKFVVTNNHVPKVSNISGTKKWDDKDNQDGIRPDKITVNLSADNIVIDSKDVSESDNWTYTFENLPVYKVGQVGQPIVYTVQEVAVADYTASIEGYDITNSYIPGKTSVNVAKVWNDNNNRDNVRPEDVTIKLFKHTAKETKKVDTGKTVTLNEANNWQATFNDLDINQPVGEKIIYTVQEAAVVNNPKAEGTSDMTKKYESSIKGTAEEGFTVTNTRDIDTVDLKGKKTWDDNNNRDAKRPGSITIHLLADGEAALDENGKEIAPITVTGNNTAKTWDYEFKGLPKHKAVKAGETIKEAKAIVYTVKEEMDQKDITPKYTIAESGMNVTNAREVDTVDLEGTKTWSDFNNQDGKRPEKIKVTLLADGHEALDENGEKIKPITVKGGNTADTWSYEFKNVPKHRAVKEGKTIDKAEPIVYTVKEEVSKKLINEEYVIKEEGMNVTNSRPLDKVSFKGNKVWDDANNQDGIRPENITVNLFADGEKVASQEVTGSRGFEEKDATWSYEFKDLPKHAKGKVGKEIKYTVTEEKVANYETKIKGGTITNSYKPQETRIFVEKAWDDAKNQDGKRPEDIAIQLYADGKALTGKQLTLSSANKWKASIKKLPVKFKGQDIKYSVEEISAAAEKVGYKAKIAYSVNKENKQNKDVLVTNSRAVELTSVSGKKTWNDADNQDGKRSDKVTINLLADGKEIASEEVSAETDWAYSFTDLPVYKVGEVGQKVIYTIEEEAVEGYEATITETDNGFDVKNTHEVELTEIKGNKIWKDADDQDGIRPDKVTINLLANGEKIDSTTADEKSDWKYEFTNLPVYEVGKVGQKVAYTVEEEAVEGYEATQENNNFTNTHEVELTEIKGNKIWDDADNQDGIRPDKVTINLLANGEKIDSTTADEKSDWKYEFTNLPVYEVGKVGQKVTYTVEEEAVESYESTQEGTDFTNTHKVELISIPVKKIWNDANNQDGVRPNEIKLNLYGVDKEEPIATKILAGDMTSDEWNFTFEGLEKYAKNKVGEVIEYTLVEEAVKGYDEPVIEGSTKDGFTVTNTHEVELISIPVKKIWKDADNKAGIRPESITVNLFADEKAVKDAKGNNVSVTFKGSMDVNEWTYEFKDLPKFKAGKEIKYSVTENKVDGYETEIKGFTITNTHTPKESGKKPTTTNNSGSSNSSSKGTTSKIGSLPKTGEAETSALVNLGMAVLLVLFGSNVWFARKRKLD